jgi:hypothetical protein
MAYGSVMWYCTRNNPPGCSPAWTVPSGQAGPSNPGAEMPAYASQQVVYGTAFLDTIIAALKTVPAAALINGAKVRLNTNLAYNPQPGDSITTNTANEANYSGYTAGGIAVVLGTPVNLSPTCQGTIFNATFTAATASPFVPNVCYGYWVDDGTNVIMGEKFAAGTSYSFGSPGDFLELIGQVPQQANQATV